LIADSVIAKAFRRAHLYRMPRAGCSVARYGRYIDDMRTWAAELGTPPRDAGATVEADDLEMIMFGFNALPGGAWAFHV
jgi:hypothetical protein